MQKLSPQCINAQTTKSLKHGSFRQNRLSSASFSFSGLGSESALASVSADDVRDVINVSSAEVPDVKVLKMVKRAEVALELETGKEIDHNCSNVKKEHILGFLHCALCFHSYDNRYLFLARIQ
jgi:hypothetical protein